MPPFEKREILLALFAVLSVLIVAYSLLVLQQVLLGVLAVGSLWLAYLFWEFVRVLGRIATALEARVEQENAD